MTYADDIFVFGSNLAGRHGAGAARHARLYWGASYGVGEGLTGRAYALPTKDHAIRTLPLAEIAKHINFFLKFADNRTDLRFLVTRIGCGLAGYKDEQIAPLFAEAGDNVHFDPKWGVYLPGHNTITEWM